jgi:hypothetical protein
MNLIKEQLREAHEAAYKVYSILLEVTEQIRASVGFEDDDVEGQIEELTEIADELHSSLFEMIENN